MRPMIRTLAMVTACGLLAGCSDDPPTQKTPAKRAPAAAKTAPVGEMPPPGDPAVPGSPDDPPVPGAQVAKASAQTTIEGTVRLGDGAAHLDLSHAALVITLRPVVEGAPGQIVASSRVDGVKLPHAYSFNAAALMVGTALSGSYLVEAWLERPSTGNAPFAQGALPGVDAGSRSADVTLSEPPGGPDDPPGAGGPPGPSEAR